MAPAGVAELVAAGHEIVVETRATIGSGFSGSEYPHAEARLGNAEET